MERNGRDKDEVNPLVTVAAGDKGDCMGEWCDFKNWGHPNEEWAWQKGQKVKSLVLGMLILRCKWGAQLKISTKQWEEWTRRWKVGNKLGCIQHSSIICLINTSIYYKPPGYQTLY